MPVIRLPDQQELHPLRVFFEKSGRAVYISHLDLMRAMGRALARTELPVWYTQGFHPHLYMTFALPLSLGVTGLRESMDIRLTQPVAVDEVVARLDTALPEGLRALSAAEPVLEPKEIFWADYAMTLRCDPAQGKEAAARLAALSELPMEKRGKKGLRIVDIRPLFELLGCAEQPRGVELSLRCRAGVETNLNPALILAALEATCGLSAAQATITRQGAMTEALTPFS